VPKWAPFLRQKVRDVVTVEKQQTFSRVSYHPSGLHNSSFLFSSSHTRRQLVRTLTDIRYINSTTQQNSYVCPAWLDAVIFTPADCEHKDEHHSNFNQDEGSARGFGSRKWRLGHDSTRRRLVCPYAFSLPNPPVLTPRAAAFTLKPSVGQGVMLVSCRMGRTVLASLT